MRRWSSTAYAASGRPQHGFCVPAHLLPVQLPARSSPRAVCLSLPLLPVRPGGVADRLSPLLASLPLFRI
eukprot:3009994-Alexandrium_andersonii.AAC.1